MGRNETTATSTVLLNGEQAKLELENLNKRARSLKESMKLAKLDGNVAEYEKLNKQLKGLSKEIRGVRNDSFNAKKVLDDLSGSSLKDLYSAQKKIQGLLKNGQVERGTQEWKDFTANLKKVKKEIESVNAEMSIGESKVDKFVGGLKRMSVVAVGIAIVAGMKAWLDDIMQFSKAVSQLSAITGAHGKDLDFLREKAKTLGAQYALSATDIIEAMKLVGSAKPELMTNVQALSDMTESVLVLAKASDMELAPTTESLAIIMNQFGLSAVEANRVINTLAAGAKFGSVEVDYLGASISKVGSVAESAGLGLEQVVAVMELFGEKGIKAEIAGTGFKSLLGELQKDTKNYTNGIFDLNKAIDNNKNIAGDNLKLQEKFGKEYYNLAGILFKNRERFAELTEQVTGTTTAFEQYNVAVDNLSGDVDKLTSGWNSFILALEDGHGPISNISRSMTQWLTGVIDYVKILTKNFKELSLGAYDKKASEKLKIYQEVWGEDANKVENITAEIKSKKQVVDNLMDALENQKLKLSKAPIYDIGGKWAKSQEEINKRIKDFEHSINIEKTYINQLAGLRQSLTVIPIAPIADEDGNASDGSDDKKKGKNESPYKIALTELESSALKRTLVLKKMHSDMSLSEELYNEMSEVNLMISLEEKLKLQQKFKEDTIETEIAIIDLKEKQDNTDLKRAENWKNKLKEIGKMELPAIMENSSIIDTESYTLSLRLKILEAFHKNGLRSEDEYQKELAKLLGANQSEINQYLKDEGLKSNEERYKEGLIGEKQYLDNNRQIYQNYIEEKFAKEEQLAADISAIANAAADLSSTIQDAELLRIDNKYAKELEAATKAGEDTTALEEKIENEKKEVKKKYADVDFAITSAQIIASTALAVMNALKIPPPFGEILAGIVGLSGLAQLGVANEQRQSIKNLYTGGYTEPGDKYKPAGIVHAGEFVGNQDAVRSMPVRKVFDLIDHAQKTNTVGRISNEDIARVVGIRKGYADGGYTPSLQTNAAMASTGVSKEELAWAINIAMRENNAATAALVSELRKGVKAKVSVSGKDGINEAVNNYDTIIKNARR